MNRIIIFNAMLLAFVLAGCSTLNGNWKKHLPWSAEKRMKESKAEGPSSLVAIWTPDILTQTGKPPTRGFGGRFYFYNSKSQAIPVEGQLMVYAYDDSEAKHSDSNPERKYAFTPEQFERHYSKSDLGPSYSVWIPWDAVGGDQKNISLVPVFTGSNGQLVMGQQAINVLPGRIVAKSETPNPEFENFRMAQGAEPSGVQPVAHFAAPQVAGMPTDASIANANIGGLKTSTIYVPKSMQMRLMQPQSPSKVAGPQFNAGISPAEGNWGTVQTTSETIREPDRAKPIPQPAMAPGQPVPAQTGSSPMAPAQIGPASPPEAFPGSQPRHLPSNRSAHPIYPARSWRGGTASPSGDPLPPFHAGPLSSLRPASGPQPQKQNLEDWSPAAGT
jgi:hypothetical protein